MSKVLSIPAQTFQVAVRFTAFPGDTIVVANGMCLGLYKEPDKSAKVTTTKKQAEPPTVTEEMVLEVLRVSTPLNAFAIGNQLGLDPKDREARDVLGFLIRSLISKGAVKRTNPRNRLGPYCLA